MPAPGIVLVAIVALAAPPLVAEERTQRFDQDPAWDGQNHRADEPEPRTVRQDFGYSRTAHAGSAPGEMGGFITPAAEPAYYARPLPEHSFDQPLSASGKLACIGRRFHVLLGFFNAQTLNEWRTPNTIVLRLSGEGEVFYAYAEYATSRWRAGGDGPPRGFATETDPATGRERPRGFSSQGAVHAWSIAYDPHGDDGRGAIAATIGDETAIVHLAEGHRADGATFNRFGLMNVMKSADDGGEVWLDDVTVNGETTDFSHDPGWEGFANRRTYVTDNVRPRFDFGFSPTQFAAGRDAGELGGLVFRGDCRYAEKMASYGDRLDELSLDRPLRASGRVCLRRGVTDSTVLIGFFHSRESLRVNPSQDSGLPASFLGVEIEGPSREGFYFSPAYRVGEDAQAHAIDRMPPRIYPDGQPHAWTLEYAPAADGGATAISVTLDEQAVRLEMPREHAASAARFDRFGLVTTWIDGNGQHVYLDDLTYTCRQE